MKVDQLKLPPSIELPLSNGNGRSLNNALWSKRKRPGILCRSRAFDSVQR
jgi:hypothetical protein